MSITNGSTFWLRWTDFNASGSDNGLGVDDFSIYATATPSPELQLVDNTTANQNCGYTIDFGTKTLSTNTDLIFDIKNIGSLDLTVNSLGVTGDYSIVSPVGGFTLTSGNSQTVTVRFTPTTNGTRTGVLTNTKEKNSFISNRFWLDLTSDNGVFNQIGLDM